MHLLLCEGIYVALLLVCQGIFWLLICFLEHCELMVCIVFFMLWLPPSAQDVFTILHNNAMRLLHLLRTCNMWNCHVSFASMNTRDSSFA
jgi:hypothetical protein